MSYDYQTERPYVFTEDGVHDVMAVAERVRACIKYSGAVDMTQATACKLRTGDGWKELALVDYLVETGRLKEVTPPDTAGQDRVFVDPARWA